MIKEVYLDIKENIWLLIVPLVFIIILVMILILFEEPRALEPMEMSLFY